MISKNLKDIYNFLFEGLETSCVNLISDVLEIKYLHKYLNKEKKLTSEQKKQVKDFWKKYKRISPVWCRYYSVQNGIFDPRYIPNTLYYTKIDQHFNNRKLGWGFNDKNYYSKIFEGIKQPVVLVRIINGVLLDEEYNLLDVSSAMEIMAREQEVICKPSQETGSGRDITFWRTDSDAEEIRSFLSERKGDYIIQRVIKQHPELDKVHKGSVNTVRIASILLDDGVHILSSTLRMGVGKSRVDNVTAGGISCGILPDGILKKYAHAYYTGESFDKHPQGLVFEGFKVPGYDNAVELVKKAAQRIPHFRLVSWDIAIDESGEAVFIEANMRKGGINLHQFDNGPLFGELTDKVLDEVFGRRTCDL